MTFTFVCVDCSVWASIFIRDEDVVSMVHYCSWCHKPMEPMSITP